MSCGGNSEGVIGSCRQRAGERRETFSGRTVLRSGGDEGTVIG